MSSHTTLDTPSDTSRRGGIFLTLFGVCAAIVLVPAQLAVLRRVGLSVDGTTETLLLGVACFARGLLLQSPGHLAALLLRSGRRRRLSLVVGSGWTIAVSGFVLLDLSLVELYDRHLTEYIGYLVEPQALHWVGEIRPNSWVHAWRLQIAGLAVAAVGAASMAVVAARSGRARLLPRTLAALWLAPLVASPALLLHSTFAESAPMLLETLPTFGLSWSPPSIVDGSLTDRASALYSRHFRTVRRTPSSVGLNSAEMSGNRPHVVLIVVESFRVDALLPEVMPNLWALSERGVRFERHYSGSNASHGGFFSLLFGRPAIDYQVIVDSGRTPDLVGLLRDAGYGTRFVSGAELGWRGMERFLGTETFDEVVVHTEGANWKRDVNVAASIQSMLEKADGPQLVVGFFMSTHFAFDFPRQRRPFRPIIRAPKAVDPSLVDQAEGLRNRYRNSANFVDSLIGEIADSLDLANTLLVVTGDHGESIFDDGTLAHSSRLSDIQTGVPLALIGAGVASGVVIDEPTSHHNLVDTLLPLLGLNSTNRPGSDLLAEASRPAYVSLVGVDPSGAYEQVVLRSARHRYSIVLSKHEAKIRFHGILGEDGELAGRGPTAEDETRLMGWLGDFLGRWWPTR